ncbi:MAG: polysaccharide biosynthesis protein [Clostridia bacterium]|nr:polysaccharide biosynthesis protein [Clostridia bacterium]
MRKRVLVKNTAILSATSLLLKAVGILFRIYLSARIGAEGMGLYQLIFSVYVLGSTFAASGISTAVTRLTTDELVVGDPASVRRVLRRAIGLTLLIAGISTALFFAAAPLIGEIFIRDARAVTALRVLAFGFPFMGVSSCIRGYFIARRSVTSSAASQIVEQGSRIALIAWLLGRASSDLGDACAAVMLGDVASEALACGWLTVSYLRDRRRVSCAADGIEPTPRGRILRRLLAIAAPITAGRYVNTILRTVENFLVPKGLARYADSQSAGLSQFGTLKGMVMPLLFFPSSFLGAFSTLLIPEIAEARTRGQDEAVRRTVARTLHITLTASVLIGGLFWQFAYPLGQLLYHSDEVGFLLRVLAPLVPVMYVESVADGILKGLNQQVRSLWYSLADSALRIALILWLVPRYGMAGFLFIILLSNIFTSGLNTRRLCVVARVPVPWSRWVLRPALCVAAGIAAGSALLRYTPLGTLPAVAQMVIGGIVTCAAYAGLLFGSGCVTREEFSMVHRKSPTLSI